MTRPLRPSEQHKMLLDAASWLERLAHDHATFVAHLRDWSGGLTSGGGPQPKNAVSDPTAAAALAQDPWSQIRSRSADLILAVYRASKDLDAMRREVVSPPPPKEPAERGLPKCCNPNCPDDAWAEKAGRCSPCYQYKRRTDRDRRKSKEGEA